MSLWYNTNLTLTFPQPYFYLTFCKTSSETKKYAIIGKHRGDDYGSFIFTK